MPSTYQRLALIGKSDSVEADQVLIRLVPILQSHGVEIILDQNVARRVGASSFPNCTLLAAEKVPGSAQAVIVAGGDGTMLHAARLAAPHAVPLVGINLGRLGFLTDIGIATLTQEVDDLLQGKFTSETRTMLDMTLSVGDEPLDAGLALNDVTVMKGDLGRVIAMEVKVDNHHVYTLLADGLLISTPTGSTAYSLSANGPLVMPSLNALALVPLYPHVLSCRPLMLPDSACIVVMLQPPHSGIIHCDGQLQREVSPGETVKIQRSAHTVQLLHPPGYNYFNTLRTKLHWGG